MKIDRIFAFFAIPLLIVLSVATFLFGRFLALFAKRHWHATHLPIKNANLPTPSS